MAVAKASALVHCRDTRSGSVARPRCSRKASSGASEPPVSTRVSRRAASRAGSPTATPPVASLCPPMYFVAECTTMSAPHSSGRHTTGEANVESTTRAAPAPWAASASSGRSATDMVGLARVSAQTTSAPPPTAARTAAGSVPSTKSTRTPKRASTRVSTEYVPP